MLTALKTAFLTVVHAATSPATESVAAVDGRFDDWQNAVQVGEPWDDAGPGLDLGPARWRRDANGLWLMLQTRRPANLAFGGRTLTIMLDFAPGGLVYRDQIGVDRVVEYSPFQPNWQERVGARVGRASDGQWVFDGVDTLGVVSAPTWASDRYELLIGALPVDTSVKVAVSIWNDAGDDAIDWFEVPAAQPGDPREPAALTPAAPGALRLLTWNLGGNELLQRGTILRRMLAAIEPDLLMLDEMPPEADAIWLRQWLPPGSWHVHQGVGGGRQRQIIAGRLPLEPVPALNPLPYAPADLAVIRERGSRRMKRDAAHSPTQPVTAVTASWSGQPVTLVSVDLQCCGTLGSIHDWARQRQLQATVEALGAAGALDRPLVLAGDLNLVGGTAPLIWLTTRTGLRALDPLTPDGLTNATWSNPEEIFPPGRLDFVLVSERFTASRELILDPRRLGESERQRLGLRDDDAALLSDHLPLIVDLTLTDAPGAGNSPAGDR